MTIKINIAKFSDANLAEQLELLREARRKLIRQMFDIDTDIVEIKKEIEYRKRIFNDPDKS
jgi:hypothetical protein